MPGASFAEAVLVNEAGEIFDTTLVDCPERPAHPNHGDGPVIAKKFPGPPSYTSTRLLGMPDGQIFHVITRGTELMPAYGGQIAPEDRWNVIHYVRRLQARAPIRLAAVRR